MYVLSGKCVGETRAHGICMREHPASDSLEIYI